jgi:hypothetical protein
MIVSLGVGCFAPDLGEGRVACGQNDLCPTNYACHSVDKRCYSIGYAFLPGGGDLSGSVGGGGDMTGELPPDLRGVIVSTDMAGADMTMVSTSCTPGEALCKNPSQVAICSFSMGKWQPVDDRVCPQQSVCMSGHCTPPPNPTACTSDKDCGGGVCLPYVVSGAFVQYCAAALTSGVNAKQCQNGSTGITYTTKCPSGECVQSTGGIKGCLSLCSMASQCSSNMCNGIGLPNAIEGVSTASLKTCAP